MTLHDFIFSGGRYRVMRHISFWLTWLLFAACVQLTAFGTATVTWHQMVVNQILKAVNRTPWQILFCYVVVYKLVPQFIPQKKYRQFLVSFLLAVLLLWLITYAWFAVVTNKLSSRYIGMPLWNPYLTIFLSFYSNINFTGAIPACCFMLAIKYYKDWMVKQKESRILVLENKQAELQLLKAQIHPHFLFNTLNNIYSFTLTKSAQAPQLVDKLAGLTEYMVSEGEKAFVSLEKEIQLINDYISLEKVRYGDRLIIEKRISGDYKNKAIAPLLLIPFVENCFKHGASVMRGQQWIHLAINASQDVLEFEIRNSKPSAEASQKGKPGIGLLNVKKRLALVYPGKHQLVINDAENIFTVRLTLPLQALTYDTNRETLTGIPVESGLATNINQ